MKKIEMSKDELAAMRAFGGWRMLSLLCKDFDATMGPIEGGSSHPRGYGQGYWLSYNRTGIKIEHGIGSRDVVAAVKWTKVKRFGAQLPADLRTRMAEVLRLHERHARQGHTIQWPVGATDEVKEKFQTEVWEPRAKAGALILDRVNALLDEALATDADVQEAWAAIAEANAILASLGQ